MLVRLQKPKIKNFSAHNEISLKLIESKYSRKTFPYVKYSGANKAGRKFLNLESRVSRQKLFEQYKSLERQKLIFNTHIKLAWKH